MLVLLALLEMEMCMARISDHPVRLARLALGWSQAELASRAGVQRSAVTAIEDGRTKRPSQVVLGVLAAGQGRSVADLESEIESWLGSPAVLRVRPAVENLMLIPPYTLGQYYRSWVQWRREVAPSATALASMLRLNAAVVSRYEAGGYKRGMPEVLSVRLLQTFGPLGMSEDYVLELERLPAHE